MNKKIVQHPSTPDVVLNPRLLIEQCLAKVFPEVIKTMAEFGFNIEDGEFHTDLRLVIEFTRALLLKQRGVHHDLQLALGTNNVLNTDE